MELIFSNCWMSMSACVPAQAGSSFLHFICLRVCLCVHADRNTQTGQDKECPISNGNQDTLKPWTPTSLLNSRTNIFQHSFALPYFLHFQHFDIRNSNVRLFDCSGGSRLIQRIGISKRNAGNPAGILRATKLVAFLKEVAASAASFNVKEFVF